MSKKRTFFLILLVVIFAVIYLLSDPLKSETKTRVLKPEELTPIQKVKFFDETTFFPGVEKAKNIKSLDFKIRGGIVPHHLFAGDIIADFFKRVSFQKPKVLILIGPNHYEKGNFKALSSFNNWETPFGIIESDRGLIQKLIANNLVEIDEEVLINDHATSATLPFIKYFMPETKIVQILLKKSFSERESEILVENLNNLIDEDVVVVAAVDFSHYLTNFEAKKKDEVTLKVMKDFDYPKLYSLNNEYLDSPSSIGVLLKLMEKLNSTNMNLIINTNSGEIQNNNSIETTSYFSILYL